ncbi:aminoglycoside phosphotransferase family protein [Maritalea sp.]|uniref:aminoglycoside phosphotransferase family protein n=1 Tax=Maritalea sp. TaxID=2003361 RepID=UPI003EF4D3E9
MVRQEHTLDEVRAILTEYAAEWADLPLKQLVSTGTDNTLYRLADDYVLRIPKRDSAILPLKKELIWLPRLRGLPLRVPQVVFHAKTTYDLGFDFGIFKWENGQIATPDQLPNRMQAAKSLAQFLSALHQVETVNAPKAGAENHNRGVDLAVLTEKTHASIVILADEIDTNKAREMWELGCSAPVVERPVWIHGDLKADNMISCDGELKAVIDWGLSAVGDPAVDYATAWTWIEPECRDTFQDECNIVEDDWHRAKSWALYCAVISLSYYRGRSHKELCEQSRLTLQRLELC